MSSYKNMPPIRDHSCAPGGECHGDEEKRAVYEVRDRYGCILTMVGTRTDQQATDLFDCWTSESTDGDGIDIRYWPLDRALVPLGNDRQALYGEPHETPQYRGPFILRGLVKKPEKSTEATEEGLTQDFRGKLYVARAEFERHKLPAPKEGDIAQFWDLPFYAAWGQPHRETIPGAGFYFDVVNVEGDAYPFGGPLFTEFVMSLKRDTRFAPERKITGDAPQEDARDGF